MANTRNNRLLHPISLIEIIIAVSTIAGGLYAMSIIPSLDLFITSASPLASVLGAPMAVLAFGIILVVAGSGMLWGIIKGSIGVLRTSIFICIIAKFYATIGFWLIEGLLPLTWLNGFVIVLILCVLWLMHGQRGK